MFLIVAPNVLGQDLASPRILDVTEDDRVATLFWNSRTDIYDLEYDPDKRDGIYSYFVEWGPVGEDFRHTVVTPYRAFQAQPLEPGVTYRARISALGALGETSAPSEEVTFSHDPTRVNDMRERLTGFFDDMNIERGPFDETKWNQAYSGCMRMGYVSQHINHQYHGHNVIASGHCDRGMASSRARELFDFRDRTGVIEFDLDGAHMRRHTWYLDLTGADRVRDVTGHINNVGVAADPAHFLRIEESGSRIRVYIAGEDGIFNPISDAYRNDACGDRLVYCPDENLQPLINVRRHWRIELSKTDIRIFINSVLVIDGNLITPATPTGLAFEVAQINWLSFSYNTNKENLIMSMIHWDNFGFDAPAGYVDSLVTHNYTDGKLGTETPRSGNEFSIGMVPRLDEPGTTTIPIPDPLEDASGDQARSATLFFTMQGGHHTWTSQDRVIINGHEYPVEEPQSEIADFDGRLVTTFSPYSQRIVLDPKHLISGDNELLFYFDQPRILNIHLEITFPADQAPPFTPPKEIFSDHMSKLMEFREVADAVGPGIFFAGIDGHPFLSEEFESVYQPTPEIDRWYVKQTPIEGEVPLVIEGNSWAQLAALGSAKGISYVEVWVDKVPIDTIRTDVGQAVATTLFEYMLDTRRISNGVHELYVQGYDKQGNPSLFDSWSAAAIPGEYLPVLIDIQNTTTGVDLRALDESISFYPNPTGELFQIEGDLQQYDISILGADGSLYQQLSSANGRATIDLGQLPSGMYMVSLVHRENGLLHVEKIVKQ